MFALAAMRIRCGHNNRINQVPNHRITFTCRQRERKRARCGRVFIFNTNWFSDPDVTDCPSGSFACGDDDCIDENVVCDGNDDCMGGTDELNCSTYICGK